MKYRLLHELPHDPQTCLGWLLDARGVEDIEGYVYPSKEYEVMVFLKNDKPGNATYIMSLQQGLYILNRIVGKNGAKKNDKKVLDILCLRC